MHIMHRLPKTVKILPFRKPSGVPILFPAQGGWRGLSTVGSLPEGVHGDLSHMTYTFKLSRRLALAHLCPMLALLAFVAGCNASDLTTSSDSYSATTIPMAAGKAKGAGGDKPGNGQGRDRKNDSPGDSPSFARILISPDPTSVMVGASTRFLAVGVFEDGSKAEAQVTWNATGGTIDSLGRYRAGNNPGQFRVSAKSVSAELADTAAVTVTPGTTHVTSVTLSPTSVSLPTGGSQRFTASAKLSDGSTSTANIAYQATGGSVTDNGYYTAGATAGTYRLIAAISGVADTATIQIEAATPPDQSCARHVRVSTTSALSSALSAALPGDCIAMSAGTYSLNTVYVTRSGTAQSPITLRGEGSATVLTLGGSGGIYLRASHWQVRSLRITNGFFGIQTEGAANVELDSLEIDHMKQAAINLRYGTHHSTVRRSRIHDTGLGTARYGEGVYIGGYASAGSTAVDHLADDNQVIDNRFGPNVTAEAVDLSAGADRALIRGNVIDGTGTVSEYGAMNALIGVRGVGHQITDNVLAKGAPYGIDVYEGSATFRRNRISLQSSAVGIRRAGGTITVYCDNMVTEILQGGSAYSVSCTQ